MQILDYNDFIKYIKEGLISTHNYIKYENSIKSILFGYGIKSEITPINDYKFNLRINNFQVSQDGAHQKVLLLLINNFGYYASEFRIYLKNGMEKDFKFDIDLFIDETNKMGKLIDHVTITFESKYEDGLYKNALPIPDFLYHVTNEKYLDKILKIGLVPKAQNRLSKHPGRIHFTYSIDDAKDLINKFNFSDSNNNLLQQNYVILQIDCRSDELKDRLMLHTDPNMITNGCYTYDNINKLFISVA